MSILSTTKITITTQVITATIRPETKIKTRDAAAVADKKAAAATGNGASGPEEY